MKAHEIEILRNAKAIVTRYQNDQTAQEMVAHHKTIIAKLGPVENKIVVCTYAQNMVGLVKGDELVIVKETGWFMVGKVIRTGYKYKINKNTMQGAGYKKGYAPSFSE